MGERKGRVSCRELKTQVSFGWKKFVRLKIEDLAGKHHQYGW